MADPKPLSPHVSAASQLRPEDMSVFRAQGFASIINNRPDDEEVGQPSSAEIEAAALAAGLSYLHAPVRGMPDEQAVAAVADRLKADSDRGVRT
ncbi:MAG TPA: sulfur transferase domain-containing protein, partial [Brevundimonas sp.]|nr:sulfur transferase domain-containing protein [Brevundimonas sp.]